MKLSKLIDQLGAKEIAKRLFITNGVDSLLSTIGVVTGTFVASHAQDPRTYLGASLGGALSLGLLSGFLGVYLTERSERKEELEEMEKEIMGDLSHSLYAKATNYLAFYVALWSALGSLGLPLIALTPFMVATLVQMNINDVVFATIAIAYAELLLLGAYSGRSLKSALSYLALGLAATLIAMLLGDFLT